MLTGAVAPTYRKPVGLAVEYAINLPASQPARSMLLQHSRTLKAFTRVGAEPICRSVHTRTVTFENAVKPASI